MSGPPGGLSPAQQALLASRLQGRKKVTETPLRSAGDGPAPVSAEQEQLLFHSWFAPTDPLYNETVTILKHGPLDVDALRTAFAAVVERHSAWRTTFRRRGGRAEQVIGPAASFPMPLHDLGGLQPEDQDSAALELLREEALRPYDLSEGPLVRTLLIRFSATEHRLHLCLHHLVFDGVSLYRVVLPELAALYEATLTGVAAALAEPTQYVDYATWQRSGPLEADLARHLPFWRDYLADAPTLRLPIIRQRPPARRFHGTTAWFTVSPEVARGLQSRGQATGSTLFQVLLGAFALLLHELTGDQDLVVATVADLRRRREVESMVGYCLTPLPLRLTATRIMSFDEIVAGVRAELLTALGHVLPLSAVVADLNPPHPPGANPLFQAMFVLEPQSSSPDPDWRLHQLDPRTGELGLAKNDLHMEIDQRPSGELLGRLIVTTDLFDDDFASVTTDRWVALLTNLAEPAQPGP